MLALKYIILTIAILCSIWIACWIAYGISNLVLSVKYKKPFNVRINFLWILCAALAWSAFFVFF